MLWAAEGSQAGEAGDRVQNEDAALRRKIQAGGRGACRGSARQREAFALSGVGSEGRTDADRRGHRDSRGRGS